MTVCHSRSRDLAALTRPADIVVVAIGQAQFLKADMVRPGAVVVDVGINRLPDGKLAGDVDFDAVARGRLGHHAGARRRRADDDHHAAAQHAASGDEKVSLCLTREIRHVLRARFQLGAISDPLT